MSLKKMAIELNTGVAFMEGRENAEVILKTILTIVDFDFLTGDDGEYAVFIVKEDDSHFFFGGMVLTEKLKTLRDQMSEEDWEELNTMGLPVLFDKRKSKKSKKEYTTCVFYPEENM